MRKLIVVLVVTLTACGSSGTKVVDKPTVTTTATTATTVEQTTVTAAPQVAHVGATLSLTTQNSMMDITLVRILDPAQPSTSMTPDAGKRFVAVQVKMTNRGTGPVTEYPRNDARLVDADSQKFDPDYGEVANCQDFGTSSAQAPGDSLLGCITFQLPIGAKLARFQFALGSAFDGTEGKWLIP